MVELVEGIKLQNVQTRAVLTLDMVSTNDYILNSVDWGQVTSTHHSYKYVNQIGVYVTGTSLETRNVEINGWVVAENEAQMTQRKQVLNRFFNPQQAIDLMYSVYTLRFLPNTSVRYSATVAENNEVVCKFKIEGYCPDPLFSEQV
ncbi:MAG: phage tail family protein, partial [Bacteroidales bacterium]|nr:phage tail family protein [Candidatus Scybalousia scybalohippi]